MVPRLSVWAIVGESNSGKSTMIGHLTGQFGAKRNGLSGGRSDGFSKILLRSNAYMTIWTRRMALQEAGLSPEKAFAEISKKFNSSKRPSDCTSILIALRDQQHSGLADGDEYLNYFSNQGWNINSFVLMHSVEKADRYLSLGVPSYTFISTDSTPDVELSSRPISHRVGQIRNHFAWA
jgi:hypothetical protein